MTDRSIFSRLISPPSPRKIASVLYDLCLGEKITCFEAQAIHGEPVLHSTISDLRNEYGVPIMSAPVKRRRPNGTTSQPNIYWVPNDPEVLDIGLYLLVSKWGFKLPPGVPLPAYNPKKQDDQPDLFE